MDEKLFISSVVIFSTFSLIYGNLALDAIGKKNAMFVQKHPIIMYLTILFYVIFVTTTMYKEKFQEKMFEIIIMTIVLFLAIVILVSSHPIVAIIVMFFILIAYIWSIQKPSNKTIDYI